MPFFRCLIRGENFVLDAFKSPIEFVGFYTTRNVEATDCDDAELKALENLKVDPDWQRPGIKELMPNARVHFEEIVEIDSMPETGPGRGHTFFPMNDDNTKLDAKDIEKQASN